MRTWDEVLKEDLRASAEEAAEYLRGIAEENDPQLLAHALRQVCAARGSLEQLGLSAAELAAMLTVLTTQPAALPQAA